MELNRVAFHFEDGANYLVSDQPLVCFPEPFAGMNVGDKVSGLGSRKRASWRMKPGYFIQYHGQYNLGNNTYVVFLSQGKEVISQGLYWYYAFAILLESDDRLYCHTQFNAGYDIVVDEIQPFTEAKEVVNG